MKILLFIFLAYGITNIIVFGSIFEGFRNFFNKINPNFLGKLVSCPLCLSTWVGGVLSIIIFNLGYPTPFSIYGIDYSPIRVFFDACFTSGCVWCVHTIIEHFES